MPQNSTLVACVCERCGTAFSIEPKEARRGRGRYCSMACRWPPRRILPHPDDPTAALVELTRGKWATIDAADAELVRPYRWSAFPGGKTWYAYTTTSGRRTMFMHRLIAGTPEGQLTDHEDFDGLNNRRRNLRPANRSESGAHRDLRPAKSGYRGVWPRWRRWQAMIVVNRKRRHLGIFATAEEAARAYDAAAREAFGAFAVLNFPDEAG